MVTLRFKRAILARRDAVHQHLLMSLLISLLLFVALSIADASQMVSGRWLLEIPLFSFLVLRPLWLWLGRQWQEHRMLSKPTSHQNTAGFITIAWHKRYRTNILLYHGFFTLIPILLLFGTPDNPYALLSWIFFLSPLLGGWFAQARFRRGIKKIA